MCYSTIGKEKGTKERNRPPAILVKTGLFKEVFLNLRIRIAEHRRKSTVGLSAWGAVLYFSPNRGCVRILILQLTQHRLHADARAITSATITCIPLKRFSRIFLSPFYHENIRKEPVSCPKSTFLISIQTESSH